MHALHNLTRCLGNLWSSQIHLNPLLWVEQWIYSSFISCRFLNQFAPSESHFAFVRWYQRFKLKAVQLSSGVVKTAWCQLDGIYLRCCWWTWWMGDMSCPTVRPPKSRCFSLLLIAVELQNIPGVNGAAHPLCLVWAGEYYEYQLYSDHFQKNERMPANIQRYSECNLPSTECTEYRLAMLI